MMIGGAHLAALALIRRHIPRTLPNVPSLTE
jgi:hypothetical protein